MKNHPVVIKMMKKRALRCSLAVKEFDVELGVLRCARHRNIVRFYGSGNDPRRFIVMEYLNEGTLSEALRQDTIGKRLSLIVALQRALDLSDVLHYLHGLCTENISIIHRDLKADNIGFRDGCLKLFDFGLSACVVRGNELDEVYQMTGFTGTLRYMAPEVALSHRYNEKVDVYSFGILLWQMLTGLTPFKSVQKQDFLSEVVKGGMRPIIDSIWPLELSCLIESCWSPCYKSRPSFEMINNTLSEILQNIDENR